jgi:hypothetical protein
VLQTEKIQLAVFTPFNILASYIFPLKRALAFKHKEIAWDWLSGLVTLIQNLKSKIVEPYPLDIKK